MMFETNFKKRGNSYFVCVPKNIVDDLGSETKIYVTISTEKNDEAEQKNTAFASASKNNVIDDLKDEISKKEKGDKKKPNAFAKKTKESKPAGPFSFCPKHKCFYHSCGCQY